MNKKKNVFVCLLISVLILVLIIITVAGVRVYKSIYKNNPYKDLDTMAAADVFSVEGEYYVYFQKETCKYCDNITNDILQLSKHEKVYIIDTQDVRNQELGSYDWDLHYKNNMTEIGKLDLKGNIIFYDKYTDSNLKSYFSEADYSIHKADDEFVQQYKNGVKGRVYALLEKPIINYENVSPTTMVVPGVPFLIHVKNKSIANYYCGDTAIIELLGSKMEPLMPYIE